MEPDVSQNFSVHSLHSMGFLPQNKQADLQDMNCCFVHPAEGSVEPWMVRQGAEVKRKEKQPTSDSSTQVIKAASEPQRQ